jgi:hypothetical protein
LALRVKSAGCAGAIATRLAGGTSGAVLGGRRDSMLTTL